MRLSKTGPSAPPKLKPLEQLLTQAAVSNLLGISEKTLERWRIYSKGPTAIKVGGAVRYRPSDVQEWLATRRTIGEKPKDRSQD